jgi:beta-glucosidase-like glycosyl hydrolase
MILSTRLRLLALGSAIALAACATGCAADSGEDADADGESTDSAFTGTPNNEIGQLFMIEHFGVNATGFADVHAMIKTKNLGALILWNPENASGEVARTMATKYAATAHAAGKDELFIAADQEEKGTQRFKSRHGFTDLVSAAQLGAAVEKNGNARVCELHAQITAREMSSAGLNMTLGTVSDIYTRDSGTPGMFRTRSIGSNSDIVAECIEAMTKSYGKEGHVVFVTKHFPGLGNASGNTDVDPNVRTYSDTTAEMENELKPYRHATASVDAAGTEALFGSMVSHASYSILDGTKSPATLSSQILSTFFRADANQSITGGKDKDGHDAAFHGMGFKGITVSDAFWTWGATKNLSNLQKQRLMVRSFLAGMDMLMIAKAEFNGAWDYFQMLNAGTLSDGEKATIALQAGFPSFAAVQAKFKERLAESAQRIHAAKAKVGPVSGMIGSGPASNASRDLVAEYHRLTQ